MTTLGGWVGDRLLAMRLFVFEGNAPLKYRKSFDLMQKM